MKHIYFITSLVCSFLASGCSLILDPGESPQRFTLEAVKPITGKTSKYKIMIDLPNVYPPIDNQRIAVVPSMNQIDYYADCEWGDRIGILIQDSLVYSLQNSMLFSGVTRTYDGMAPDLLIKTDVRKFFIVQKPQPIAVIQYYLQLIDLRDRQIIAQKVFESNTHLRNEQISEIILNFNNANLDIITQILDWLTVNTILSH